MALKLEAIYLDLNLEAISLALNLEAISLALNLEAISLALNLEALSIALKGFSTKFGVDLNYLKIIVKVIWQKIYIQECEGGGG